VIGLTVAVLAAERGLTVRVWTRAEPGDTTSAVASAMIGPAGGPGDSRGQAGVAAFTALAGEPGTGVTMRRGRLASREPGELPPGVRACAAAEIPAGYAVAGWARLPIVEMPVYLDYLVRRLAAAGGTIGPASFSSLAELASLAPLVANCTGLGARELVPDAELTPVRGQHVIVANPGIEEFFIADPYAPEWAAYWPYPGHVVLGGIRASGDERDEPDPAVAEAIVRRCAAVEPRLGAAPVLGHHTGLRPLRPAVRLDAEQVGGTRVVHNYGHGGGGVTQSWGCAAEALALLLSE